MHDFRYERASSVEEAVAALAGDTGARLVAGGTDLLNLLKDRQERPAVLIDVSRLPLDGITADETGLRVGALARLSDVAAHPRVREDYPAIAVALEASASPQLRNMATMGGNLMQRTRCPYFRAETELPCHQRRRGSGCAVRRGEQRDAAIFDTGRRCVATHPSDLAVALTALDARIRVRGPRGERTLPVDGFYPRSDEAPDRHTALGRDEMIIAIEVPASPLAASSRYLKVRDRASYDFALVSVAAAVETDVGVIRRARIAVGGVAAGPLRLREAEERLAGTGGDAESVRRAVEPSFAGARPLPGSAFKVELAVRAVVRTLTGSPV